MQCQHTRPLMLLPQAQSTEHICSLAQRWRETNLALPLNTAPRVGVLPEQEGIRAQLNVFELKGIENKSVSAL